MKPRRLAFLLRRSHILEDVEECRTNELARLSTCGSVLEGIVNCDDPSLAPPFVKLTQLSGGLTSGRNFALD